MTFPPFVYVKAFWQSLSYTVAGVLGLLAIFGVIGLEWALTPVAILNMVLGFLKFFDIEPQARLRALLAAEAAKAKSTKKVK